MPLDDDIAIWEKLRQGKEEALVTLMRRYHGPMLSYARKLTADAVLAEDQTQELFVYLWTNRQQLGPTTAVRPYLLASLRRRLLRIKQQERRITYTADPLEVPFLTQFTIEESLIEDEIHQQQLRRLNYLRNALPTRQRESLYLKFYQNLTNEQIAEVMHIGYQSATNLIYRALTFLRQHWHEEFSTILLFSLFS